MIDSLYIGATGMQTQQTQVDVIANNLANANTAGFKRNTVEFKDLLYREVGAVNSNQQTDRTAFNIYGMGSSISASRKVFTVGDAKRTDGELDLAIRGQGFFEVSLADGQVAYTRSGSFTRNQDGMLVTQDGLELSSQIQIPVDATDIKISTDGKVSVSISGQNSRSDVGSIELMNFINPAALEPVGDNLYRATEGSGDAMRGIPGEQGMGTLAQGFLENSNVKLVDELVNLVVAQRAYEINSRVVQASDEILSITNNLMR